MVVTLESLQEDAFDGGAAPSAAFRLAWRRAGEAWLANVLLGEMDIMLAWLIQTALRRLSDLRRDMHLVAAIAELPAAYPCDILYFYMERSDWETLRAHGIVWRSPDQAIAYLRGAYVVSMLVTDAVAHRALAAAKAAGFTSSDLRTAWTSARARFPHLDW